VLDELVGMLENALGTDAGKWEGATVGVTVGDSLGDRLGVAEVASLASAKGPQSVNY